MKKAFFIFMAMFLAIPAVTMATVKVNGAGASFPYPLYSAWAHSYQKDTKIQINYQSIGSGGGIRQISSRTVDFGASDAPLKVKDQAKKKLLQFPAVIGGVVPVVNIVGVKSGQLKLTTKQLSDILLGKIRSWSDTALKSNNPGLKLPNSKITVVHRSDGSGTTAIFTGYMSAVSKEWKNKVGAGKVVKWPAGIGGKGNEGVANYIRRVKNSIGYVEFAYAKNNKLSFVKLQNKDGNFVTPSFDSFKSAANSAKWSDQNGFYLWLFNSPGKNSWPIAGATFILLAKENTDANKKVVQFYDWAFKNGSGMAKKLIYVPLPDSLQNKIRSYWKANGIY